MLSSSIARPAEQTGHGNTVYRTLFLDNIPLLDVRAPVEFDKGAFPQACNIPLLNDEERRLVGTAYKESGPTAALALGHKLVSGELKQTRIAQWHQWREQHPDGWLYCFRGGLRSQITQQWLAEAGVECPRVPGGYKAMRQFLIDTIENTSKTCDFIIVAGRTGSGKTLLLQHLERAVDLEKLAGHRGSAFGTQLAGQPSQINFENALAISFLEMQNNIAETIYLEDESHAIGSLSVPCTLYETMKKAPIALIEESLESRTSTILNDYISDNLQQYRNQNPDQGFEQFSNWLLNCLTRIQKRLGGDRYKDIYEDMHAALRIQEASGDSKAHSVWIRKLLEQYYDPMYAYQLSRRLERVIFQGCREEFLQWAEARRAAGSTPA